MNHHNFIYDGNELLAFGNNLSGQLGLGDIINRIKPTPVMKNKNIRQIVFEQYHTFILEESGLDLPMSSSPSSSPTFEHFLWALGDNRCGQLGLNDYKSRDIPTLVMKNKTIRQVICGAHHSFILSELGELFAFGNNFDGQLGLGDNQSRHIPTLVMQDLEIQNVVCGARHSFILKESGELFAFGRNYKGQLGLGDNKDRNIPTLVMQDKPCSPCLQTPG